MIFHQFTVRIKIRSVKKKKRDFRLVLGIFEIKYSIDETLNYIINTNT